MKKISGRLKDNEIKARSDWELIQQVAMERDVIAFQEIFHRHRNAASSLAFRIIHNRAAADDIFQDVMLTVWISAGNYRNTGKVSSWILRIVALKSMQYSRGQRRRLQRIVRPLTTTNYASPIENSPVEHYEELGLLRIALGYLSRNDRHMLALYFDGDLSKTELSKKLSLPNSTINYRVRACLHKLKHSMAN